MPLRNFLTLTTFITIQLVTPYTQADTKSHHQAAEEFLIAYGTDKELEKYPDIYVQSIMKMLEKPGASTEDREIFETKIANLKDKAKEIFSWDKLKEYYIKATMDIYTKDELVELTNFFNSTIGKSFLRKQDEFSERFKKEGNQSYITSLKNLNDLFNDLARDISISNIEKSKEINLTDSQYQQRKTESISLNEIKYPSDPSTENLKEYVAKIFNASRGQKSYSSNDPQIDMIAKIGEENIDILLDRRFSNEIYTKYAIEVLATADSRDKIIKALESNPEFITIISYNNWENYAKPTLIKILRKKPRRLGYGWSDAIAALNDPETYDDLRQLFIYSHNKSHVYEILKNLPDFDFKDSIDIAWNNAKMRPGFTKIDTAKIAIKKGYVDALGTVIEHIDSRYYYQDRILSMLKKYTGITGSGQDYKEWYEHNKDRIYFDSYQNKYMY